MIDQKDKNVTFISQTNHQTHMKAILCWRMLWERRANQLHPFLSHADIIILCLWCQKYHIWHQVGLKGHSGMPKYPTRCHNVTHGGASTHIAHHKVKEKHNLWNLKFYSIICIWKKDLCITRFSWKNLNETIEYWQSTFNLINFLEYRLYVLSKIFQAFPDSCF